MSSCCTFLIWRQLQNPIEQHNTHLLITGTSATHTHIIFVLDLAFMLQSLNIHHFQHFNSTAFSTKGSHPISDFSNFKISGSLLCFYLLDRIYFVNPYMTWAAQPGTFPLFSLLLFSRLPPRVTDPAECYSMRSVRLPCCIRWTWQRQQQTWARGRGSPAYSFWMRFAVICHSIHTMMFTWRCCSCKLLSEVACTH